MPRVLDHVEKLELSDDQCELHFNELKSLGYLAQGLAFLYRQVKSFEDEIVKQVRPDETVVLFGNAPEFEQIPLGLVACAFHWYAVPACNYAQLVGWLTNEGDSTKARAYVKRVLPAVHVWRNKVAAHFARSDPKSRDTPADLALSVMFPVGFVMDAFYTNPFDLMLSSGGQSSISGPDMRWSVTHTHVELCRRYWPSGSF